METIILSRVLNNLRPNSVWVLKNNDYNQLDWQDNSPKPTYEELIEEWDRIKDEIAWEPVREKRDQLLKESDWVMSPDINIINRIDWFLYRQTLRDLPELFEDPNNVVWPEKPEVVVSDAENENNLFKAELFINNFYSPTRLLQMKTWWDEIPHQLTPKLSATYVWIESVTKFAITTVELDPEQLQNFQPPFTFVDISQEIRGVLYPVTVLEELSSTEVEDLSSTENFELSGTEIPELSSTEVEDLSSTETEELSSES